MPPPRPWRCALRLTTLGAGPPRRACPTPGGSTRMFRHPRLTLLSLTCLLVLAIAGSAFASSYRSTPLDGSSFQGADGNQNAGWMDPTSAPDPVTNPGLY